MRIDINTLTYSEIKEIVERLQNLKMDTEFKRKNYKVFLCTKNKP